MANDEILEHDRPGRKSGIRRLVYRPSPDNERRYKRSWPDIKDQLRRTLRRAPEVVIIVSGSRRGRDDDRAAIKGVLRYMLYISRNGRLVTVDEQGAALDGRRAIRDTHAGWDLDMQRLRSARGEPLHPSFNVIFSMPARTEPDKMFAAVQAFAREHFQRHQYVMSLHTPETDPGKDVPEHPHVHVIVRAEDEDGRRLSIRKGTLRAWREQFAAQLRARGVDANATARAERGISLKAHGAAEWHIDKRIEDEQRSGQLGSATNKARRARFQEVAQELADSCTEPKPWELAMAARRRDEERKHAQYAARLREEGDVELADQVDHFVQDMPPLDNERRQMQRTIVEQVKKTRQNPGLEQ